MAENLKNDGCDRFAVTIPIASFKTLGFLLSISATSFGSVVQNFVSKGFD